ARCCRNCHICKRDRGTPAPETSLAAAAGLRTARQRPRADKSRECDMTYLRFVGQFIVVAGLFAAVAAFSDWPVYRQVPRGSAIVMLTFVHGADRKSECRRLTPEEINKLPPNMRRVQECPRGRRPIYVEL